MVFLAILRLYELQKPAGTPRQRYFFRLSIIAAILKGAQLIIMLIAAASGIASLRVVSCYGIMDAS
jgi:hypothetical protein